MSAITRARAWIEDRGSLGDIVADALVWLAGLVSIVTVGWAFAAIVALRPIIGPLAIYGLVVGWACYRLGCHGVADVRDQLGYAARHLAAVNGSPARDDLAAGYGLAMEPEPWIGEGERPLLGLTCPCGAPANHRADDGALHCDPCLDALTAPVGEGTAS